MKIDLVGPASRGLAMGLNEAAGYLAVSLAALASGYLAAAYALRPQPFYLGVVFALAGLIVSVFFVRETHGLARHESALLNGRAVPVPDKLSFAQILLLTSWFWPWAGAMALLGLGTAMVYPTLLAAVSDVAHPNWRASAVGVYRLWRDGGYALGALLAGVLADLLGVPWAIAAIALLTFA